MSSTTRLVAQLHPSSGDLVLTRLGGGTIAHFRISDLDPLYAGHLATAINELAVLDDETLKKERG